MPLERQAFEAHMRINNGFDNITLDGVGIDVCFSDESGAGVLASSDPNDTQARFFIRNADSVFRTALLNREPEMVVWKIGNPAVYNKRTENFVKSIKEDLCKH